MPNPFRLAETVYGMVKSGAELVENGAAEKTALTCLEEVRSAINNPQQLIQEVRQAVGDMQMGVHDSIIDLLQRGRQILNSAEPRSWTIPRRDGFLPDERIDTKLGRFIDGDNGNKHQFYWNGKEQLRIPGLNGNRLGLINLHPGFRVANEAQRMIVPGTEITEQPSSYHLRFPDATTADLIAPDEAFLRGKSAGNSWTMLIEKDGRYQYISPDGRKAHVTRDGSMLAQENDGIVFMESAPGAEEGLFHSSMRRGPGRFGSIIRYKPDGSIRLEPGQPSADNPGVWLNKPKRT